MAHAIEPETVVVTTGRADRPDRTRVHRAAVPAGVRDGEGFTARAPQRRLLWATALAAIAAAGWSAALALT
ncbi:MAG: hypothetical protein ACJ77Z_20845, partial [Thermoleophilaceae bacterium]